VAIGSAIVLFVFGAILAYGVELDIAGLNLEVIGFILMAAGVIGGIIGALMMMSGRRRSVTQEAHRTVDGGEVRHTEERF
jgi:hypothetical protein